MTFTTNQIVILALVLVLGWLLGLASRSGGAKWKAQAAEDRARADAAEARIAAADARIAELERHAPAVGVGTAGSIAAAARGGRDDLTVIRGVDGARETQMNDAGYHSFAQVARMSDTDAAALEGRLALTSGEVDRQEWREQARLLAARNHDEHRRRWG